MPVTEPDAEDSWCTVALVADITGKTVDALARNLAANAVELVTGLIEAVPRSEIARADRYWLRQAVAFQAAWIFDTPDYLERNSLGSISQDGQSVAAGNADWLVLAPLARKAVKRLSWRGVRSIDTNAPIRVIVRDALLDTSDEQSAWSAV